VFHEELIYKYHIATMLDDICHKSLPSMSPITNNLEENPQLMSPTRSHSYEMSEPVTFDQLNEAMEPMLVLLATLGQKLTLLDDKVTNLDNNFGEIHHRMNCYEVIAKSIQNGRSEAFSHVPIRNGDCPEVDFSTTNEHVIASSRSTLYIADNTSSKKGQSSYLGDELVDDSDRDDRPTFMRHRLKAVKVFGVTRTRCIQACILGILIKVLFF
jgi:hypothetical protein